jgi:hypothetical protein
LTRLSLSVKGNIRWGKEVIHFGCLSLPALRFIILVVVDFLQDGLAADVPTVPQVEEVIGQSRVKVQSNTLRMEPKLRRIT